MLLAVLDSDRFADKSRPRPGPSCWMRAPTWPVSRPCTRCCAASTRSASAALRPPPRQGPPGTGRHRPVPGLVLGHNQAERTIAGNLLRPVRDTEHFLPQSNQMEVHATENGDLAKHSSSTLSLLTAALTPAIIPELAEAEFLDLWSTGAPYNPLALEDTNPRAITTAVIELRDAVDEATKTFTRMGVKQRGKLQVALEAAYQTGRQEGRWPTLQTLDGLLDDDLAAVLGDLTRHELFRAGEPLGTVIDRNVIFGLSTIPGNGQTTVLAAGFILSALLLRIQNLPPVPNTIRYVMVVDEAHRVTGFKAIQTMAREGRSKGLALVLATQQPLDLPEVVAANAQTKICFGLPDATVAAMAARKLQPDNPRLAEQIRTLGVGEAVLALAGSSPRLMRMAQAYRDADALGLPPLTRA